MKKFEVTYYYATQYTIEVSAENEKDAIEKGYSMYGSDIDNQLVCNIQEINRPYVEQIGEEVENA